MPSNHLILCHHLLLLPPTPSSIRVFSNESVLCIRWPKYWSFSFSISPSNEYSGLISFRIDWLDIVLYKTKSEAMKTCLKFTCSSVTSGIYLLNQVTIFDNLENIFSVFCAIHNITTTDAPTFVTKLVTWTYAKVLAQAETPCLGQGGSFSAQICIASKETDAETGTAQLYSMAKMEKLELSLQINFSAWLGGDIMCIAGSRSRSPAFQADSLPSESPAKPIKGRELSKEKEEYSWNIWEQGSGIWLHLSVDSVRIALN